MQVWIECSEKASGSVDTNQNCWPFPINRNQLERPDQSFCWGLCCSKGEWKQKVSLLGYSLVGGGGEWWESGKSIGICPRIGSEGWLRCFAPHSGGVGCRGACSVPCFCSQHPLLALGSSEVEVGIWGLFASFVQSLPPTGHECSYWFVQVQALQHCSKGPRSQPV